MEVVEDGAERDLQEEPESTIGSKPEHQAPEERRQEEPETELPHKARWEEEAEAMWSPETWPHVPPPAASIRK